MTTETKLVSFDWAIKNILRDKANFDILEGFLTALLGEDISVLEILESESNQSDFAKKVNRVDILVNDSQDRKIIIEVQNYRESGYIERILWGASKLVVETLEMGDDYRNISKVISVSIVYFDFGANDDNEYIYHGNTDLQGLHTQKPFTFRRMTTDRKFSILSTKDIFPEFYLLRVEYFQDVIKTDLDEWIYMLKHSSIKTGFKAKNIDKAQEKLTLLKMNPKERKVYERYIMEMVIERDVFNTARTDGIEEGIKEGIQKGIQEGIKEGIQKGIQEGIQEGVQKGNKEKTVAIIKNSLQQGLDLATIASITDLSIAEVETIRDGL